MKNTLIKKKRILFVVPLPPPYAGPEVASEILINSSLRDNFHIYRLKSNVHSSNDQKGKITLLSIAKLAYLLLRMMLITLFSRVNVVYAILSQNTSGFIRDSFLVIVAKLLGRKMVFHFRGSDFDNFYNSKNYLFKRYIQFILDRVDVVILQAYWVKEEVFNEFLPGEKLKVVYNAVPENVFVYSSERETSAGGMTVLYMNHLSVAKGLLLLFQAINQILKKTDNINFIIAGDIINKERNILFHRDGRKIAFKDINSAINAIQNDKNISRNVKFVGEIRDMKTKLEFLRSGDVFVLPSYSEGCPMSVLEAMVCGLSVIVTPVGALREVIKDGENGLFVSYGDAEELSEKILYLNDNPELRKVMGQNNKVLARAKFGLDTIVSQLNLIFQQL